MVGDDDLKVWREVFYCVKNQSIHVIYSLFITREFADDRQKEQVAFVPKKNLEESAFSQVILMRHEI